MQTRGLREYLNFTYKDHPVLLLPGIQSDDRWNGKLPDLVEALASKCRLAGREDLLTGVSRLLTPPGINAQPMPYPPSSSGTHAPDKALRNIDEVLDFLAPSIRERFLNANLRLRKDANVSVPAMTRDLGYKLRMTSKILNNLPEVGELIMADEFATLADKYDMAFLSIVRRRFYPDSNKLTFRGDRLVNVEPKDRYCVTPDGKRHLIDKSVRGNKLLVANRSRTIVAVPMAVNFLGQPISQAVVDACAKDFPTLWSASDVPNFFQKNADVFKNYSFYSGDIKEYDSNVPLNMAHHICDRLCEILCLEPWVNKWMKIVLSEPWACNPVTSHGQNSLSKPFISGSFLHPIRDGRWNGLGSGTWCTTVLGFMGVGPQLLGASKDLGLIKRFDDLHINKLPKIIPLDKSDDVAFGLHNSLGVSPREFLDAVEAQAPMFKFDVDEVPQFLSNIIRQGERGITIVPDLGRALCKTLVPESPLPDRYLQISFTPRKEKFFQQIDHDLSSGKGRSFPILGLETRNNDYKRRDPFFGELWDVVMDHIERFFYRDYRLLLRRYAELEREYLDHLEVDATSMIDLDLINHPEKILYNSYNDEVVDRILKVHYLVYSNEDLQNNYFKHFTSLRRNHV